MKIFLLMLIAGVCDAKVSNEKISSDLLYAIEEQESSHQADPNGWNDNGKAKGWYQCHRDYWEDGCKFLKVEWPWSDATNHDRATKVVRAYLETYGKVYKKKTGKEPTDETYAMIHHYGPNGWKNPNKRYWYDIRRRLETASKRNSKKSRDS